MFRPKTVFGAETFRTIHVWATLAALCLAPLPFGSSDPIWPAIWAVVLSIGLICGVTAPMTVSQTRLLLVFLVVCGAYALVATIQIVPNFIDRLNDPVWRKANDLLSLGVSPRISSRATIPDVAIANLLLLLTSFVSGFFVGISRRDTDTLVMAARYSILLYAIYGVLALALTPGMTLWAPKPAYIGSVTSTFINHNTAATFIGAGAILWFSAACLSMQSLQLTSIRLLLLIQANERRAFKVIFQAGAGFICLFALLLTGSRGGLICTMVGLFVAAGLVVSGNKKLGRWYAILSGSAVLTVGAIWLSQIGRIGSHGLFDDTRWSVYGYCLEAIRQRPLLGAGAGTFADLFPSLRGDRISGWGIWEYAHSTILEIAVEMGIPIATLVIVTACASLVVLGRAALRSKDAGLSAITGIAVLSYVHSAIDFSLQIPGYLIPFAILLGCGLARACSNELSRTSSRARSTSAQSA